MIDSIQVYVRKGLDKSERLLSFIPPGEFSQKELVDTGWAIDGNQALRSIGVKELFSVERELVDSFRQKGYEIQFC